MESSSGIMIYLAVIVRVGRNHACLYFSNELPTILDYEVHEKSQYAMTIKYWIPFQVYVTCLQM